MPYWLERMDDETRAVFTKDPGNGGDAYPTEVEAHEAALGDLLDHRSTINAAIRETKRRIKACRTP